MSIELFRAWALLATGLFLSSLLHEDVAILAGGYLVVEKHLPAALAAGSLYAGVVAGDLAIYTLGRLARRSDRLSRLLGRFGRTLPPSWLSHRLLWIVVGCRLTPTMLFPTFAAIGWSRVPFRRFAGAVLVSATLYVPPVFVAVVIFGATLIQRLEAWGWPVMATGIAAIWLVRRRIGAVAVPPIEQLGKVVRIHRGMPPLASDSVRVPLSERVHPLLFYAPIAVHWLCLGLRHGCQTLPTVANPGMEAGGLLGESKSACLDLFGPSGQDWVARSVAVDTVDGPEGLAASRARLLAAMGAAGLVFPVIAKPDIGWRGIGVRRLDAAADAGAYLASFPLGQRLIIQEYVPYDGEAGVFYARRPGETVGRIFSLALRYYPFVVGDGHSTLRQLILANERTRWKAPLHFAAQASNLETVPANGEGVRLAAVGSNRVGGLYVDGRPWLTAALHARFDALSRGMREFWFGRFDVRFASMEAFQAGEGFRIIEVNGAGAEAIHIWDPNFPLLDAYRTLFQQQSLMFAIAAANRRRGFAPLSLRRLVGYQQRQQRLLRLYPESN